VKETTKATVPRPWLDPKARAFLLRKLFSLTGVIPLAAFTVLHLARKASAIQGREAFLHATEGTEASPFLAALFTGLDIVFIFLPLLVHALVGLLIVLDASYNVGTYPRNRNWMFTLQRVSGVLALGFVAYHLYELRVPRLLGKLRASDVFDTLCADLSTTMGGVPVIALVYVLGVAAVSFHLANGLWGALCSWGITVSQRAQRVAATCLGVVGLIVFVLGANTTVYFATGSTYFLPPSAGERDTTEHCSASVMPLPVAPPPDSASQAGSPPAADSPSPTDTPPTADGDPPADDVPPADNEQSEPAAAPANSAP